VPVLAWRPDGLIPTFSVRGLAGAPRQAAERLAHPAGTDLDRRLLDPDALRVIATGLAQAVPGPSHDWTQGRRRRYTRLLGSPLCDAWLIHWSAAADLELHDHGGSQGVVVVAGGRLVETYTDLQRAHPLRTQMVERGGALAISASRVHGVSNPGPGDALSVHVYSPPLREMTFFDHRPGSFLTPIFTSKGDLAELEEGTT
jgi:Cysteine dioxygenase type I